MPSTSSSSLIRFASKVLWVLLSSWQYGFHIAALNASEVSLTCENTINGFSRGGGGNDGLFGLVTCVKMTKFGFGVLT